MAKRKDYNSLECDIDRKTNKQVSTISMVVYYKVATSFYFRKIE